MIERDFKVGDRVKATKSYCGNQNIVGVSGIVVFSDIWTVTVEFDIDIDGNNGNDDCHGKERHCWSYAYHAVHEHLELEKKEAYNTPYAPESVYIYAEEPKHFNLSIDMPNGSKLLEGEFEASNGELYEVTINKVLI